jgi:hypothetical protein
VGKRELSAAFILELERKKVFILPARIDDTDIPTLLKDRLYADFRGDYGQVLERLMLRLVPETGSSAMLRSVPALRLHYLPAVTKGHFVSTLDLNRALLAINALERRVGLQVSDLPLYRKGQLIRASDINRRSRGGLYEGIRLRDRRLLRARV